jgi:hypothetical protein
MTVAPRARGRRPQTFTEADINLPRPPAESVENDPELAPTTSVAMKSSAARRRHYGQMVGVAPPSTRNVVPVMKSLRGLAIMQTAKAMSLASLILPTVWRRTFLMAKSRLTAGS